MCYVNSPIISTLHSTDMNSSLFKLCLLTVCLVVVSARLYDRWGEPINNQPREDASTQQDFFRDWVQHRRSCKEKWSPCSSSTECCNTGCGMTLDRTAKAQCQICSYDAGRGHKVCWYPWMTSWAKRTFHLKSLVCSDDVGVSSSFFNLESFFSVTLKRFYFCVFVTCLTCKS